MVGHHVPPQGAETLRVGIVGLGSRGLGILERLLALAAQTPDRMVDITVFEPGEPGCGTHRTDQPDWLLLNTIACQLSVFPDHAAIDAPGRDGPDFYRWCTERGLRLSEDGQVSLDKGRTVRPTDFLPRRLLGEYLSWAYEHVTNVLPSNVRLTVLQELAINVEPQPLHQGFRVVGSERSEVLVDRLFLTTGHARQRQLPPSMPPGRIANVYPLPETMTNIAPHAVVVIEGLGLTAMDVLAALTKGRGGRFSREGNKLTYEKSGLEPRILMYSRSGLPFRTRPFALPDRIRHTPLFLTKEELERTRQRLSPASLDFDNHLLPLLLAEMRAAYYLASSLLVRPSDLQRAFEQGLLEKTFDTLAAQFGAFDPLEHLITRLPSLAESGYAQWAKAFIEQDLKQSRMGLAESPLKVALEVWRDLRDTLRDAVNGAGLTAESRARFYAHYSPLINRTVAGPQLERHEELLALIEAGHVHLTHRLDDARPWDWTIGANVSSAGLGRGDSPLFTALQSYGCVRPISSATSLDGIDVDADAHPRHADGHVSPHLWLLGPAAEGATYYNHYVPSAGAWSRALSDAHRAACACLGLANRTSIETSPVPERIV
ncbi:MULTISPECIES: FAD/NAD(P)-binding protein [unclassified Pseudomonas]|uniref:FAD/NAD(P)-binding protein n=1 Tax=unclassified Pseudomonas TaxID=196821 RepID=UPI0025E9ED2C|nr:MULTISPECIES: FAD/NAD(P)-binding protein [unclassified Pseudomonas]